MASQTLPNSRALDGQRRRLHNTIGGSSPLIAPMNSTTTQNSVLKSRRRRLAFAVSLLVLLCSSLRPVIPQSRSQKHITSVWTATSAAGSTVHVVSDASVNDYEAYTRGGRFYVKIPAADLPTARGSLLGRGFDDVQIQRYGDGIIISFHLLPGTSARVQQSSERLNIVFTTPGSRSALPTDTVAESNRVRSRRVEDKSGPSPVSSVASKTSRVSEGRHYSSPGTSNAASKSGAGKGAQSASNRGTAGAAEATKPTRSKEVVSASPLASSGAVASSSPGSGPTSVTSPPSQSSAASSPVSQSSAPATRVASSSDSDWNSRLNYWKIWAQLNWIPIAIGSLIALALIAFLFFRRSGKRMAAADVKPKESVAALSETVASKPATRTPTTAVESQANAASAAASSSGHVTHQTQSSSPAPDQPEKEQEVDPDREVFEL
jgi:hypothetical protein